MSDTMGGGLLTSRDSMFAIQGELEKSATEQFSDRQQYIGLLIGSERFLMSIADVAEIINPPAITYVPFGPPFIEGVINLRGTIIPVVNARKLTASTRAGLTSATRIIVVRSEQSVWGLIVDGISSVESLLPSEIEESTLAGSTPASALLSGVAKAGKAMLGIVDVNRVSALIAPDKPTATPTA